MASLKPLGMCACERLGIRRCKKRGKGRQVAGVEGEDTKC